MKPNNLLTFWGSRRRIGGLLFKIRLGQVPLISFIVSLLIVSLARIEFSGAVPAPSLLELELAAFEEGTAALRLPVLSRKKRSGLIDKEHKYCEDGETKGCETPDDLKGGYKLYRKRLDWKAAHQYCETHQGHLAPFINKDDADQVIDKIFSLSHFSEDYDWGKTTEEMGLDRRYWIGLTDIIEEGQWSWAGMGKKLNYDTLWYPNQPDHVTQDGKVKSGRPQHCVSLWNPAYWKTKKDESGTKDVPAEKHTFDDVECDLKLYFICFLDQKKLDAIKCAKENNCPPDQVPNMDGKPGQIGR